MGIDKNDIPEFTQVRLFLNSFFHPFSIHHDANTLHVSTNSACMYCGVF